MFRRYCLRNLAFTNFVLLLVTAEQVVSSYSSICKGIQNTSVREHFSVSRGILPLLEEGIYQFSPCLDDELDPPTNRGRNFP